MSTPDTIKAQISSLISQANAITGVSDTTLTSAIASLCSGYGGGQEETPTCYCKTVTIISAVTGGNVTLISGDDWIKEHYSDANFVCGFAQVQSTGDTSSQHISLAIAANSYLLMNRYFMAGGGNAGSLKSWSATGASYKASSNYTGTGYGHVHADSSGNIVAHAPSGYTLRAGTYIVFYGLAG